MKEFNSQICTSREQSERLLALGLKPETADMFWWDIGDGPCVVISRPAEKDDYGYGEVIPAWSLHRLIEMMRVKASMQVVPLDNTYDTLIDGIEQRIKEGYFNEEYLEEKK